jgi:multidrug efflux pump subunit AcrA (membrane-fusion protein)
MTTTMISSASRAAAFAANDLREQLELTDSQVERIQSAIRASFAGMQSGDQPPDPQVMRTRIASTIESVLTPEQMERYREVQSELTARERSTVWVLTAAGQLAPRKVAPGVADAQVTEILDGDLEEGDRVVVRVREADS